MLNNMDNTRNISANNFQILFARAGFFAIITLYQKLPLFRPPFSLPFHPSANPNLHKSSMVLAKIVKTTQKQPLFLCKERLFCFMKLIFLKKFF
jgi:hypothetical protein